MADDRRVSERPLTVEEWQDRLNTTRRLLESLGESVAVLINVARENGGDDDERIVNAIHATVGRLGNLQAQVTLAQRRIDRGLV